MDILWSCLFTIIACTWTVQHLNIPEQREGRDPGRLGDIKWQLKSTWSSTKWMLATVLAPEILVGKAWADLKHAKYDLAELQKFAEIDEIPWSLTHSLFANMGGFVIRWNMGRHAAIPRQVDRSCQAAPESANSWRTIEIVQSTLDYERQTSLDSRTGGFYNDSDVRVTSLNIDPEKTRSGTHSNSCPNPVHLTASVIIALRKADLLSRLPYITVDEINDKSKSDAFARAIAVVQIAWTVVQIIARGARHLAISQLEIAVMAFSACAVIIYALNWTKPKSVQVPHTILRYKEGIPHQVSSFLKIGSDSPAQRTLWTEAFHNQASKLCIGSAIPNDWDPSDASYNTVGTLLASVVFGGIHIAAWGFLFPTAIEQIFWRAASLWCTCIFLVVCGLSVLGNTVLGNNERLLIAIVQLVFGLYVLARLYLVVEIFRCLCFLPPDAYISTWATNFPHVA